MFDFTDPEMMNQSPPNAWLNGKPSVHQQNIKLY